jgi:hypothetical protein
MKFMNLASRACVLRVAALLLMSCSCVLVHLLTHASVAPEVTNGTEMNDVEGGVFPKDDAVRTLEDLGEAPDAFASNAGAIADNLFRNFRGFGSSVELQACFLSANVTSFGGAGDSLIDGPLRSIVGRWLHRSMLRNRRDIRSDLPVSTAALALLSAPQSSAPSETTFTAATSLANDARPHTTVRIDFWWMRTVERITEVQRHEVKGANGQHSGDGADDGAYDFGDDRGGATGRDNGVNGVQDPSVQPEGVVEVDFDFAAPASALPSSRGRRTSPPPTLPLRYTVPQVAIISRGYWDMLNLGLPPSKTFDAVRQAAIDAARTQRERFGAVALRSSVVVYVPHCPQRAVQPRHTECSGPHNVWMYRAAAACGALRAIETLESDHGEGAAAVASPIVLYDACGLMQLAPTTVLIRGDGGHFEHNVSEPALADDFLQQVVCPAWAKQRGGERLTGTWSTAGMSYAEAKAAIDARFNCSAFHDSGKPLRRYPPRRPGPMLPRWRYCPLQRRELDARLGWDFKPACSCILDRFVGYDECTTTSHMQQDVLRFKKVGFSYLTTLSHHCSRLAHKGCVRHSPTGLPAAALQQGSPLFEEIVATACLRPEALPLCFLNLGSYIVGGFNATFLRTKFAAFANVSHENSFMVCGGARSCSNRTRPFAFAHNVSVTGSVGRCAAHEHAVAVVRNLTKQRSLTCNKYVIGTVRHTCQLRRQKGTLPDNVLFHEVVQG